MARAAICSAIVPLRETHLKADTSPVIKSDIEAALRCALPLVVKNMRRVASDPKAATRERLKPMELLLRVALGPGDRPAEDVDIVASRDARNALFDAAPFLEQIAKSGRLGLNCKRAARLASRIDEIKR